MLLYVMSAFSVQRIIHSPLQTNMFMTLQADVTAVLLINLGKGKPTLSLCGLIIQHLTQ